MGQAEPKIANIKKSSMKLHSVGLESRQVLMLNPNQTALV